MLMKGKNKKINSTENYIMIKWILNIIFMIVLVVFFAGCANMFIPSTQTITITSTPDGAKIEGYPDMVTPANITVRRSTEPLNITASKDGFHSETRLLNPKKSTAWIWGNAGISALAGGLTFFIEDRASGVECLTGGLVLAGISYGIGSFFSNSNAYPNVHFNLVPDVTRQSLGRAVDMATQRSVTNIQRSSRMAITNVDVTDDAHANIVYDGIESSLLDLGFRVVDRNQLDQIRAEQAFGMSGEVDDASAAYIGRFVGASHVVMVRVQDAQVRIRILNVETAVVEGAATEMF